MCYWKVNRGTAVVIDSVVVITRVQSSLAVSTVFSCLGGAVYFSLLPHVKPGAHKPPKAAKEHPTT